MKKKYIVVVSGGTSIERETSLQSGLSVFQSLNREKYKVDLYDTESDLPALVKNRNEIDLAFITLRGKGGEDGTIQGFFETLGIPYTGSGIRASANAVDKITTKKILSHGDILTPDFLPLAKSDGMQLKNIIDQIGFPCIVKPSRGGSTQGVEEVNTEKQLEKAIRVARKIDTHILVEKFIYGREFSVLVMGDEKPEMVAYFEKEVDFDEQKSEKKLDKVLEEWSTKTYETIGCRGIAEIDLIVTEDFSKAYILEVNTNPNMYSGSIFSYSLIKNKINYSKFLDKIIRTSPKKK